MITQTLEIDTMPTNEFPNTYAEAFFDQDASGYRATVSDLLSGQPLHITARHDTAVLAMSEAMEWIRVNRRRTQAAEE